VVDSAGDLADAATQRLEQVGDPTVERVGRLAELRRRGGERSFELNAVALMAATAVTALVGLGFWALAARLPPAEVGRASAVITTATMFCQLASANIGLLFSRVLASAGHRSRRVVLIGYGLAAAIGGVLGTGYVLLFPTTLFAGANEKIAFPVIVVLFAIFSLQDWVLTGLRKAGWIPLEQLLFALAKFGLLMIVIAMPIESGIVLAWAVPVCIAVLVVNPILLGRVLPRMPEPGPGAAPMPTPRQLGGIFAAEYATGAATYVIPLVLPLLVVGHLGTEANAYFAMPWLIAESLNLLIWNISSSYMVEASHDGPKSAALMRRTFRMSLLVGVPGVLVPLVAAPWLLHILGANYADQGANLLRLMVLSIPFTTINTLYASTCRVQNRMGRVVAVQVANATLVIGMALALIGPLGINGVGLGYLVAEALISAVVFWPFLRYLRRNGVTVFGPEPEPPTEEITVVRAGAGH
jgi:O-antigen/teichoic acid export membrane protein